MSVNFIVANSVRPGMNPRTYFDPALQAELESSMRAQGILQPILVRQTDDGLYLIAGERRLRAFKAVNGADAKIPALICVMSDEECAAAALTENVIRANMTPVEEAEAAAKVLGQCLGNRDEAAKRLGWARSVLDKRLALMYASDKVREALQAKKILLGHAELLAGCRKESQDNAVEQLFKKMMSVTELKNFLETVALNLDKAIFEKTECATCHHNSANQSALFAEAITNGRCTNKVCFDTKTEAKLAAQAEALKDEYQVIRIVRPGDNLTVIPLAVDGAKGVGAEQGADCKLCKDYGAVISAAPDKMGREFKGMCLNVPCNTEKVAAQRKLEKAALEVKPKASQPDKPQAAVSGGGATTDPATASKTAKAEKSSAKPATETKAASTEPTGRVKDYREKLWRTIFQEAVAKLGASDNRAVLMAICLTRPSVLSSSKLKASLQTVISETTTSSPAKVLEAVANLEKAQLAQALNLIPACVDESSLAIVDIAGILNFFEIKIADYWKIDKAFLELLTKNEIDAVCEEIGVKAKIDGGYSKLRNGGKDEFITAIMKVKDFDFRGRVPKMMSY